MRLKRTPNQGDQTYSVPVREQLVSWLVPFSCDDCERIMYCFFPIITSRKHESQLLVCFFAACLTSRSLYKGRCFLMTMFCSSFSIASFRLLFIVPTFPRQNMNEFPSGFVWFGIMLKLEKHSFVHLSACWWLRWCSQASVVVVHSFSSSCLLPSKTSTA